MSRIANIDWSLYAIIDARSLGKDRDPAEVTAAAIRGGAGIIQFRDKIHNARKTRELAERVQSVCSAFNVPFIVNDRVDIALALAADGVHLGPHDVPPEDARRIVPNMIIGGSAGSPEAALAAVESGVDYLGSGAVFDASASKPDAHHNRGLDALRAVVAAVDVPVVGIGGITTENVHHVAQTGASGVAVIRAICQAEDVEAAARHLRAPFKSRA